MGNTVGNTTSLLQRVPISMCNVPGIQWITPRFNLTTCFASRERWHTISAAIQETSHQGMQVISQAQSRIFRIAENCACLEKRGIAGDISTGVSIQPRLRAYLDGVGAYLRLARACRKLKLNMYSYVILGYVKCNAGLRLFWLHVQLLCWLLFLWLLPCLVWKHSSLRRICP